MFSGNGGCMPPPLTINARSPALQFMVCRSTPGVMRSLAGDLGVAELDGAEGFKMLAGRDPAAPRRLSDEVRVVVRAPIEHVRLEVGAVLTEPRLERRVHVEG